jgi:hypothetical protein
MPVAGDDAAVIRPNPDPLYSSHAFMLSGPDELDDMHTESLTTRYHRGATMRALKDITRCSISRRQRVCQGVEGYHSLGDFGAGGRV